MDSCRVTRRWRLLKAGRAGWSGMGERKSSSALEHFIRLSAAYVGAAQIDWSWFCVRSLVIEPVMNETGRWGTTVDGECIPEESRLTVGRRGGGRSSSELIQPFLASLETLIHLVEDKEPGVLEALNEVHVSAKGGVKVPTNIGSCDAQVTMLELEKRNSFNLTQSKLQR